jgi:hypothetical protein
LKAQKKYRPSPVELRLHALQLAASTRRDWFKMSKDEDDVVADQILADAHRYHDWLRNGDPPDMNAPPELGQAGG